MATQSPQVSLEEVQRVYPLSSTVKRLLGSAYVARSAPRPTIDIASFLHSAATRAGTPEEQDVSTRLFGTAARERDFDRLLDMTGSQAGRMPGVVLSPGLAASISHAHKIVGIVRQTPTQVRRRYVVLAILAPRLPQIIEELDPVLYATGVNGRVAQYEIARYCVERFDEFDVREEWNRLFMEWELVDLQQPQPTRPSGAGTPAIAQAASQSAKATDRIAEVDSVSATETNEQPGAETADAASSATLDKPASSGNDAQTTLTADTTAPGIPLCDPDDPWAKGLTDRAGAEREATAFARMILTRQFKPPLAVGVFGDWGSGKSFFMRLVHDEIDRQTKSDGTASQRSGELHFLSNVVQIRFNAWHYAETNLWASLVDHIFRELDAWAERRGPRLADRLFDQLVTARQLTIESAEFLVKRRRERDKAADRLKQTQGALAQSREQAERSHALLVETLWKNLLRKKEAESRAQLERLGIEQTEKQLDELRAAVDALKSEAGRAALFRSGLVRSLGRWGFIVLLIVGTLLFPLALEKFGAWLQMRLAPATAAIAGIMASVGAVLGLASRGVNGAMDHLKGLNREFEDQLRARTSPEQADFDRAEAAMQRSETEVREAEDRLSAASARAADAARDYNAQTGRGRLLRFVRERVANGDYAKHLGFIATVRKDFEELDRLMQAPAAAPKNATDAENAFREHVARVLIDVGNELTPDERSKLLATTVREHDVDQAFDRIVLYVDDLDRCPTDKVVDVLQAVHLLLTFQLFAVFVAVDVRWLRNALTRHYTGQLSKNEFGSVSATAGDYLEKIFQIPYWVRSMDPAGTRWILADRLGPAPVDPIPAPVGAKPEGAAEVENGARRDAGADTEVGQSAKLPENRTENAEARPAAINTNALTLTSREHAFIQKIADVLDGSPRRALRFVNTYRVMKASLPEPDVADLEREGYAALLTLLALSIAASGSYPELVSSIHRATVAQTSLTDAFLAAGGATKADQERIDRALRHLSAEQTDPAFLATYARFVERFTFCARNSTEGARRSARLVRMSGFPPIQKT